MEKDPTKKMFRYKVGPKPQFYLFYILSGHLQGPHVTPMYIGLGPGRIHDFVSTAVYKRWRSVFNMFFFWVVI